MLSLKKSLDEAERQEALFRTSLACYLSAIQSVERNVIETQPALAEEHRQRLRLLHRQVTGEPTPELLEQSRGNLDAEVSNYTQQVRTLLKQKETDLQDILKILGDAVETLQVRNNQYDNRLSGVTQELEVVSRIDDLSVMRRKLADQVAELKSCVETLRREGQISVLELQKKTESFHGRLLQAEKLASTDHLTGVLNRREAENKIQERIQAGNPFCLIVLDLNRFKQINDRLGHIAGDQVLKTFADRLCQLVRPTDTVGRWGGDEFVAIMDCSLYDGMLRTRQIGERVRGNYVLKLDSGEVRVEVSASMGVAEYMRGETAEQLFNRADALQYQRKQAGTLA